MTNCLLKRIAPNIGEQCEAQDEIVNVSHLLLEDRLTIYQIFPFFGQ